MSIPSPPSTPNIARITSSQVSVTFSDGANGGSAIDSRQIGYGTSPSTVQTIVASDGSTAIAGLTPGTTYYFWARTHNTAGYSAWSARASTTMWSIPPNPSNPVISDIKQTQVKASVTDKGDGGLGIVEYQVAYDTDPNVQYLIWSSNSNTMVITGLSPGLTYYFRSRVRNSEGWSGWSAGITSATLVAGAYIKVGSEWKRAVPYVNVNGTWKVARAWGKVAGTWRETL